MIIRVRFTKGHAVRFISHLDLMRTVERAVRRANIPIAFTEGFHPRPKIGYGPALPVGTSSDSEFADFELSTDMGPATFAESLNSQLPTGIEILESRELTLPAKSLAAIIDTAGYRISLAESHEQVADAVQELLIADKLEVTRRSKGKVRQVDIRPLIMELSLTNDQETVLNVLVRTGSTGNVRPEEILSLLPVESHKARVHRCCLLVTKQDELISPLEVGNEQ